MEFSIEEHAGPRRDLAASFRDAEDSEAALAAYLDHGRVWVALTPSREVIGHLQAVARDESVWEVTNMAVTASLQGHGVGRALVERVVHEARSLGARRVIVATASADTGNLRFYQRCGFRMTHVVRDVFAPERGYPSGLEVDGVPLRDQVWFDRDV